MAKKTKKLSNRILEQEYAYQQHWDGKTLDEIAKEMGYNQRTIWKWAQGNKKQKILSWKERDLKNTKNAQNKIDKMVTNERVKEVKKAFKKHAGLTNLLQGLTARELNQIEDEVRATTDYLAKLKLVDPDEYEKKQEEFYQARYRRLGEISMASSTLMRTIEADRIRLRMDEPITEQDERPIGHYVLKLDLGDISKKLGQGQKVENIDDVQKILPHQDPFEFKQ